MLGFAEGKPLHMLVNFFSVLQKLQSKVANVNTISPLPDLLHQSLGGDVLAAAMPPSPARLPMAIGVERSLIKSMPETNAPFANDQRVSIGHQEPMAGQRPAALLPGRWRTAFGAAAAATAILDHFPRRCARALSALAVLMVESSS